MAANAKGWRRQLNRDEFDEVFEIVASPNLPQEDGSLIVDYSGSPRALIGWAGRCM